MKLQLDRKNLTCMVLEVSGPITPHDAMVLRVGFRKLLAVARNTFLIDLTQAVIEPDAEFPVLETQIDALVNNIRLVIVGPNPRICQAPDLKQAHVLRTSLVRLDKVLVPQLHQLHKRFDLRRQRAKAQLETNVPEDKPEFIIAENTRLKAIVTELERHIGKLLESHKPPVSNKDFETETAKLGDMIASELATRKLAIERGKP